LANDAKQIATAISAFMNPPFVSLFSFAVASSSAHTESALLFIATSSLFGSIIPFGLFIYLLKKGTVSDMFASARQTRMKPLAGTLVSILVGIIVLALYGAPRSLISLMACLFVNTSVMMLITRVWKISFHAAGVACFVTFLVQQMGTGMAPFFLLILPVGWARLRLGQHDFKEVAAGAFLGAALTLAQLRLYM
jgi:membrane-associated phospholipid phosphatase